MKSLNGSGETKKIFYHFLLISFYRGFMFDCPSGKLRKEKVLEMYTTILPEKNALVFVDNIFRVFDKDNNGSIDFKV